MDLTTVKAEIKAWERDFLAQNGRKAAVEDIKAQPSIAEKYKLYKKLTKQAAPPSLTQVPEPPRTPPPHGKPKQHARPNGSQPPAAILPKSRPVSATVDVLTHNPFSPVKQKAQSNSATQSTSINPFLTPLKAKRTPSPDPFPPISDFSPPPQPITQQNPAIVKARKRLRGEPVSPSPQPREKRRRLLSGNTLDALPVSHTSSRSASPAPGPVEEGDSFVVDSPVKAPAGGKAFKPLFEEANNRVPISLSQPASLKGTTRSRAFSRAKTVPSGLFGGVKKETQDARETIALRDKHDISGGESGMEVDSEIRTHGKWKEKEKGKGGIIDDLQREKKKRVLPGPKGLIPGKDDLFEGHAAAASSSSASAHNIKTSRKRTLSKVIENEPKGEAGTLGDWDLLPPSPPPRQDDGGRYNGKGKGKTKAWGTSKGKSKKAKLAPVESDEDIAAGLSSSDSAEVNVVAWRGRPRSPQGDDCTLALDPELQFHLRARAVDQTASEIFEVNLPEEMRRVLALSPHDQDREREEEDLVKGLIQGRRKGGGEVWGVGEIGGEGEESDEGAPEGGEDDWEGEGVPWEVAEL